MEVQISPLPRAPRGGQGQGRDTARAIFAYAAVAAAKMHQSLMLLASLLPGAAESPVRVGGALPRARPAEMWLEPQLLALPPTVPCTPVPAPRCPTLGGGRQAWTPDPRAKARAGGPGEEGLFVNGEGTAGPPGPHPGGGPQRRCVCRGAVRWALVSVPPGAAIPEHAQCVRSGVGRLSRGGTGSGCS